MVSTKDNEEKLALKDSLVSLAHVELLKMGKISVPFLIRKFGISYDAAFELLKKISP